MPGNPKVNRIYPLLFAIIPFLFLYISTRYIRHAGLYFSTDVDPEFNYLFNGIALAHLKFHLNAVGHPGSPIQCLIAITSRIVHIFRPGEPLWDDVMQHPWIYIRATVYTAAVINSLMLFLMARQVLKYTKSILSAIFIQVTPFAFLILIEASYRMMPELIMPAIICCWIILLVKRLYDPEPDFSRYSLLFALLFGFSLADKLTFMPFYVLPLFLLSGNQYKIRYSALAIISFLLFAFPVLFNFSKFTGWITGIISHKGVYGGGEKGFVDVPLFIWNLKTMVQSTRMTLVLVGIMVIATAVSLIRNRKTGVMHHMAIGLIILVIIQYLITAKHYALYYLTPSLLLTVFTAFMVYILFRRSFSFTKYNFIPNILLILFGSYLLFYQFTRIQNGLVALKARQIIKSEALHLFKPYLNNQTRIIVPDYYGCSSLEYALLFGVHESGRYGKELSVKMMGLYPGHIVFYPWEGYFYQGREVVFPWDFMQRQKEYTVFIAGDPGKLLQQLTDSLGAGTADSELNFQLLEQFPATREAVYSLTMK